MDAHTFDGMTRRTAMTRIGALGLGFGLVRFGTESAAGARKKNKKKKRTKKERNPCASRNWCVDRSHTCGPAGGYGKCMVTAFGGNVCAEILFQAATCAACDPSVCTDCVCMLAAGGGDRCNNGTTGHDFVCARPV